MSIQWVPFGNRAIGIRTRRPCTAAGQVTLNIPTEAFFESAPAAPNPPPVPPKPHWTQLPAAMTIDLWDLQQYIINEVKAASGYV